MTANSIANERNKLEREKTAETKRSNRAKEKIAWHDTGAKIAKAVTSGVTDAAKIFAAINDPEWYTADPQLTKDAGSLSFATPLGIAKLRGESKHIPGIASFFFTPTIGSEGYANVAAKNVYAYVRFHNSGSKNYDSPDLMMYILAMDAVFTSWAEMARAYGALKYVESLNRYSQRALFHSMGLDYEDFLRNASNLRAFMNTYRIRANQFFLPKNLTYYQRHMWLAGNVFKDDEHAKSQYYVFNPYGLHVYDEANNQLQALRRTKNVYATFSTMVLHWNRFLDVLVESESIGIMAGDILKAYGQDNVTVLPAIPEDFTLIPVYSQEVLEQIHNASILDDIDIFQFHIKQDESGYIYQGTVWDPSQLKRRGICINYEDDLGSMKTYSTILQTVNLSARDLQPTPENVLTLSRFAHTRRVYAVEVDGKTNYYDVLLSYGSEVLSAGYIYFNGLESDPDVPTSVKMDFFTSLPPSGVPAGDLNDRYKAFVTKLSYIPVFNSFPAVVATTSTVPFGHPTIEPQFKSFWSADNVITVSNTELSKLHSVAMLSMFGVPYTGTTR